MANTQVNVVGPINDPWSGTLTADAKVQLRNVTMPPAAEVPERSSLVLLTLGGLTGIGDLMRRRLMAA